MNLKTLLPHFRAGLIEREALQTQLSKALAQSRLVLLVAPAGFGKTALLSSELRRQAAHRAVAWVTLDEDDDVQRLLGHLAEALEPYDPPWRIAPEALVRQASAAAELPQIARTLLATLAATEVEHGVLALDDLHAVTDARVFELLNALLEGLPPNWSLAIASRSQPALSLARLRASREIAEFGLEALSFRVEEVLLLMKASADRGLNPDRSVEVATELLRRTQGWAAGLRLSLDGTNLSQLDGSATDRRLRQHLFSYLASEVFEQLPSHLQTFLLRCSVLPELSPDNCAAVCDLKPAEARQLLEETERRGLFVSALDSDVITLRMHDLFRGFLNEQLRLTRSNELPSLMRRAAQAESDPVRKLQLTIRAGDWDQAARQVAVMTSALLLYEDAAHVNRMIERFPADLQANSPHLAYARGLGAWHQLLDAEMHTAMTLAAEGFDRLGHAQEAQRARVHAALGLLFRGRPDDARALMAAVAQGHVDAETGVVLELCRFWDAALSGPDVGTAVHMQKLVDLLSDGAPPDLWYRCAPRLYMFLNRAGMDDALARFVRGALQAADAADPSDTADLTTLRAAAMLIDGWLALWRGGVDQAAATVERIRHDQKWLGDPATLHVPLVHLKAACHAVRGERERLGEALEGFWSKAPRAAWQMLQAHYGMIIFSLQVMTDDWPAARSALLDVERLDRLGAGPAQARILDLWRGIRHFEEGRLAESLPLLRDVAQTSQAIDHLFFDATLRIQWAAAELRSGRPAAAWEALAPLVERLGPHAEVVDVVTRGEKLLVELANASWGDAAPPGGVAALRNWARFVRRLRAENSPAPAVDASAASRLSGRELEVLERIAAGDSNKLIARALDLSPHTVKRHVARILERLGVASRGEAAALFRRLGGA